MAELDGLPADQRATLQLLLQQRKSYEELASLLGLDRDAVRARAHAALESLGPETRLTPERRAELSDYLLGQQTPAEAEATRAHVAGSAAARSWARVVAGSLRPLAAEALPEIPDVTERERSEAEPEPAPPPPEPAPTPAAAAPAPAEAAPPAPTPTPSGRFAETGIRPPSSRLGGALLLAGAGILVAVVLVLVLGGGGGGGGKKKSSTLSTSPTQTSNQPQPVAQINLLPTQRSSRAVGLAQVFAQGGNKVLIIAGQGLAPGAYALWLYTSSSQARLLGFVPNRVGKDGRFVTRGELPKDATSFQQLIVTSENIQPNTRSVPKSPGKIVLGGRLQIS